MSNTISFHGRLGHEPEYKQHNDSEHVEMSVGSDVGFGDKRTTNWFRVTKWGKGSKTLADTLKKGSHIYVSGELTLRKYTDKAGTERLSADIRADKIDFLDRKSDSPTGTQSSAPAQHHETQSTGRPATYDSATDDQIPF